MKRIKGDIFRTKKQRCNGRKRHRGYFRRLKVIMTHSELIELDKSDEDKGLDLHTKRWSYIYLMMSMLVNGGGRMKYLRPGVYSIIGLGSGRNFDMIFARDEEDDRYYIIYPKESDSKENIILPGYK